MPHHISIFERTIVTFRDHIRCHYEPQPLFSQKSRLRDSSYLRNANVLYRSEAFTRDIRSRIFGYLNPPDLRNLRLTSNVFCRVVQERFPTLFRTVYIRALACYDPKRWEGFEAVAERVTHLVITIGDQMAEGPSSFVAHKPSTGYRGRQAAPTILRPSIPQGSERHAERFPGDHANSGVNQSHNFRDPRTLLGTKDKDGLHGPWLPDLSKSTLLRTLTVRVHASCPWPGRTNLEESLLNLRHTLEGKDFQVPNLTEIRFTPVHALGILHLNWQGFSSLGSARQEVSNPDYPFSNIWTRLERLTINIPNPECPYSSTKSLTPAQTILFFKSLYHYLRAFTPTLQQLTFIWLGKTPGPCPLALHLHPWLAERKVPPLQWLKLKGLRISNTTLPQQSMQLAGKLAPNLEVMQTLRSSAPAQPHTEPNGLERGGVWVNCLPDREVLPPTVRKELSDMGDLKLEQKVTSSSPPAVSSQLAAAKYALNSRRSSIYSLASDQYVGFVASDLSEERGGKSMIRGRSLHS